MDDRQTEARIDELEIRNAHLEAALDELRAQMLDQERLISELRLQMKELARRQKEAEPGAVGPANEEPLPPHY